MVDEMSRQKDMDLPRCPWAHSRGCLEYHDREWGRPVHDDRRLFEFLVLGGAQAGLSWATILERRENYRRAFDGFDPARVAGYGQRKLRSLLGDAGIIRNRRKIESAIHNAQQVTALQAEWGSFDAYLWSFVGGETQHNVWRVPADIPARTAASDALSKDLKARNFKFAGSTICYALMQSVGMVNDHLVDCFCYAELRPPRSDR